MDYFTHGESRTIDGQSLRFIRCDSEGNVLTDAQLRGLEISNDTIESIVSAASGRLCLEDGSFALKTE